MGQSILRNDVHKQLIDDLYVVTFQCVIPNLFPPLPVLLAYRIWYLDRKTAKLRGHSKSQLRQILHIVIDAGAIYNATILAVWICFSLQSNGQFVLLDVVSHHTSLAYGNNPLNLFPLTVRSCPSSPSRFTWSLFVSGCSHSNTRLVFMRTRK